MTSWVPPCEPPRDAVSSKAMRSVEARYEDGVLKPTEPLSLKPGERVRLVVLRRSDPSRWNLARLADEPEEDAALAADGLAEWADGLDAADKH